MTLLTSCYHKEVAQSVVYLHKGNLDSLAIEIPYDINGRGWSLHNFAMDKYEISSSNWICIQKIKNIISADSLHLVYKKGYKPQSNLKGEIKINDSILDVSFKIPTYNNKKVIKGWSNYRFNGVYKIKDIHYCKHTGRIIKIQPDHSGL